MKHTILFFGDIVGKPGRKALAQVLPELRAQYKPDAVIVNIENSSHGKGITPAVMAELAPLNIDAYTSGNHIFSKGEQTITAFEQNENVIRPANYQVDSVLSKDVFVARGSFPGRGWYRFEKDGQSYLILNLNGQVFFEKQFAGSVTSPFAEIDSLLEQHAKPGDVILVDFHAEATSEKRAFGFYTDGRLSLVLGTHTHVPTADIQILPKGTGYVTDVGMCGAKNSVLGVPVENSLAIFHGGKFVYEIEEKDPISVNAVVAEVTDGLCTKIEKVYREVDVRLGAA